MASSPASAFALPPAPAGANPFEYYKQFTNLYFSLNPGFGARNIVLIGLVSW